jgi:hypothetical protein
MGGHKANLEQIEVVRIGIYNERRGYWPMKIRCVGTCYLKDPFNKNKVVAFDAIADFYFVRDDYGDWQAVLPGGVFHGLK